MHWLASRLEMTQTDQKTILEAIKNDSVVELLMREYSMLQDKIDKIGGFRFMIKGWALTLDTGAVLAAFATSLERYLGILLVFGVAATLWLLELRQIHLSEIFQNRALRIEKAIMRRLTSHGLRRTDIALLINVPGIAAEIRSPLERRILSSTMKRGKVARWFLRLRPIAWFRRSGFRRKLDVSDFYFYFLIWLFAALFICLQHSAKSPEKHENPSGHIKQTLSVPESSRPIAHGGATYGT